MLLLNNSKDSPHKKELGSQHSTSMREKKKGDDGAIPELLI